MTERRPVLVSACLLGIPCAYDAECPSLQLEPKLLAAANLVAVPVCPELLGGLPTPRGPFELRGGDGNDVLKGRASVIAMDGSDATDGFVAGARLTLAIGQAVGANVLIAQRRSPSCSCVQVYDGTFQRKLLDGAGVTSALLQRAGFRTVQADKFAEAGSVDEEDAIGH